MGPAGASVAWLGGPEGQVLSSPSLGSPFFLLRVPVPVGLRELTSSCCGFCLMELSWLSRLLWGERRQRRAGLGSWCFSSSLPRSVCMTA